MNRVTLYQKNGRRAVTSNQNPAPYFEVIVLRAPGIPPRHLVRRRGLRRHDAPRKGAGRTAPTVPAQRCGRRDSADLHRQSPGTVAALEVNERELEILTYVANGFSTKQIARRVAYSDRMIKYVLNGFVRKFKLCNRTHAVAFAIRQGLI
ncbi:response regulator transcription factor [Streptomyces lavendulae]|uniref:helix-turn-helix transcriptional regulator n=1 Tax=Streptomyces lavendulae TaxID=1914 RepID=UPI0037146E58